MRGPAVAVVILFALAAGAEPGPAQGVRGWSSTSVRFFEIRPLAGADVAAVEETAVVGSQDVGFTAWGWGVQGLSVTGLVRARDQLSGEFEWPLSTDRFDVLVGYAQLQRGALRVRAGRQETPSGLGFSGFDGGSVRVDLADGWAEVFGGRSLARGLSQTRREALRGIEDFVPDQDAYLWGGAAGVRWRGASVTARYQREIIADRSGLVAERAALDLTSVLPGAVRMRGSIDYDVPFDRVGKAHITLQRAFAEGRVLAEIEARRYLPYFELSTIWGFFSPVPYHEGRMRVSAGLGGGTGVQLSLAARDYGDASTTTIFQPLEDRGWRGESSVFWAPRETLRVDASYQIDWGASAFLQSLDAALQWRAAPNLGVRVSGTTFQQFEAFRLGDARAVGGGIALDWEVSDRARLDGGFLILRQDAGRGGADDVWNQTRSWLGLRYAFGDDPGLRARRP